MVMFDRLVAQGKDLHQRSDLQSHTSFNLQSLRLERAVKTYGATMKYYGFLQKTITIAIVLYFIIGNFTWALFKLEIYPIASWNLFSVVPNLVTDYGLQIKSINQVELEEPTYFQDLPDEFAEANSIVAFYVIQNLGIAIEKNDTESIENLREQIENEYFASQQHVEYEIYKRSYFAMDRWDTGQYEEEGRLVTFEKSTN